MVLLVVDGFGWNQLCGWRGFVLMLVGLVGGLIIMVVLFIMVTALMSITIGLQLGEHGIVGYWFLVC